MGEREPRRRNGHAQPAERRRTHGRKRAAGSRGWMVLLAAAALATIVFAVWWRLETPAVADRRPASATAPAALAPDAPRPVGKPERPAVSLAAAPVVASSAVSAVSAGHVSYQLPATPGRTYRVTLAITEAANPDWIISTFVAGAPREVTAENGGRFTESWDGLDDNFMPVPPGEYGVKGIYMPATKWPVDGEWHSVVPKYAGAGDAWAPALSDDMRPLPVTGDPCGAPLGDVDIAPGGMGVVYFVYLENAANNYRVDFTKPVGADQIVQSFGSGSAAGGTSTCTDGTNVWSFSTDGGPKFVYRADARPFGTGSGAGRRNVYRPEGWVRAMAAWRDAASGASFVYVAQGGRILQNGEGYRESDTDFVDRVTVHKGSDGVELAALVVTRPRGIAARNGSLHVLHEDAGGQFVISTTALTAGIPSPKLRRLFAVPAHVKPFDIEVDSRGRVYLSDSAANHVYQFAPGGKQLRAFGRLDAQRPGAYDRESFMAPEKLACWTDATGADRLLVVEMAGPNRLSEWSADGALLREWMTPQTQANGGYAVDPRHPSLAYMVGQRGCLNRYRIEYATGQWHIDAVWPGALDEKLADRREHPKVCYHDDTAYLAFARNGAIYRQSGDRWLASAGIITERRDNRWTRYLWRDANGDGVVADAEFRSTPLECPPGTLRYHGETFADDLSLVAIGQGTRDIWRLSPERFDEHGNPVYATWVKILTDPILAARAAGTAQSVRGGNECADTFNSDWAQCAGSIAEGWYVNARGGHNFSANFGAQVKISRYVPDGQGGYSLKWRVGRQALQGNARPGELYGPIFIDPPTNGILGVVDNSRAGYVLYTDEGLYVDTLFPDDRVVDRRSAGVYPQPGEFFTGYHYLNRENGTIYIAFGKTQPVLFKAVGWSASENPVHPIERLDNLVVITAAEIASPPDVALFVRGGAGSAKLALIAPAPGGGPSLDGSTTGWETSDPIRFQASEAQTVELRCMYDPANLYLRFHARLGREFVAKDLHPAEHLFSHDRGADTVSFYLQGDPDARPGGDAAGRPGDVRFILGVFADKGALVPVALGLYPKWFGPGANAPLTYKTPVTRASYEHVGLVTSARLHHVIDEDRQGFVIAAVFPKEALPPLPQFSGTLKTMVNVDANFGGHNRFWWANADGSASRETFDEPSEARFYPGSWAPARFGALEGELVVRTWMACGPFGGPGAETFGYDLGGSEKDRGRAFCDAARYPPDERGVDLDATYSGPMVRGYWNDPGTVRWRGARVEALDTRVVFGPSAQVWFGATWIHVSEPTNVTFRFQCHPQTYLTYSLNRQQVFDSGGKEGAGKDAPAREVALRAGWNEVIFRGFCVGYPPFRAGLSVAADAATLWRLRLSGTPPER